MLINLYHTDVARIVEIFCPGRHAATGGTIRRCVLYTKPYVNLCTAVFTFYPLPTSFDRGALSVVHLEIMPVLKISYKEFKYKTIVARLTYI